MARRDEQGATLVLALAFLVLAGGIITALLGWGTNDLTTVASFQQNRTLDYAANSAVQVEIQNVRYNPSGCGSAVTPVLIPNPIPNRDVTMDVWCSTVSDDPKSGATRVLLLKTCPSGAQAGPCSQTDPYLTVKVTFDDYASATQIATSSCTTTCGTTMTINSWVFR